MASKLTVAACVAYFFILCGMAMHVIGLLTDFWFVGKADGEDSDIQEVSFGMWNQKTIYSNDTEVNTDSRYIRREEQYIVVAVTGLNTLLCFVVLIKNIHMCVGLISFIIMSLMILSAFFTYEGIRDQQDRLQDVHSEWPELRLSWSFYLVFSGIILNIVSTLVFLTCLLIKGEIEATHSTKGFGPSKVGNDKTPIINSVSGDLAYANYSTEPGTSYSSPISNDVHHPGTSHGYDNAVYVSGNMNTYNEAHASGRDTSVTPEDRYFKDTTDINEIAFIPESCRL